MVHLIDKAAIIAEIEKRMQELRPTNTHQMQVGEKMDRDVLMWLNALTWVKKLLDTIEVKKEVDIRSEVSNWWNNHYTNVKKGYTFEGYSGHYMENSTIISLAQHFYELGIKSQKGE